MCPSVLFGSLFRRFDGRLTMRQRPRIPLSPWASFYNRMARYRLPCPGFHVASSILSMAFLSLLRQIVFQNISSNPRYGPCFRSQRGGSPRLLVGPRQALAVRAMCLGRLKRSQEVRLLFSWLYHSRKTGDAWKNSPRCHFQHYLLGQFGRTIPGGFLVGRQMYSP